jgi:hypothetical protein
MIGTTKAIMPIIGGYETGINGDPTSRSYCMKTKDQSIGPVGALVKIRKPFFRLHNWTVRIGITNQSKDPRYIGDITGNSLPHPPIGQEK